MHVVNQKPHNVDTQSTIIVNLILTTLMKGVKVKNSSTICITLETKMILGVDANPFTLSEKGGPCQNNISDFSCAICRPGKLTRS